MSTQQPTIIYTLTDEAPRLATASFLPIVRMAFVVPMLPLPMMAALSLRVMLGVLSVHRGAAGLDQWCPAGHFGLHEAAKLRGRRLKLLPKIS